MKSKKTPYDQLFELSKTIKTIASIELLLDWDQETYMPSAAIDFRAEQKALMAGHIHKLRPAPNSLICSVNSSISSQAKSLTLLCLQTSAQRLESGAETISARLNSPRPLSKPSPQHALLAAMSGSKLKKRRILPILLPTSQSLFSSAAKKPISSATKVILMTLFWTFMNQK